MIDKRNRTNFYLRGINSLIMDKDFVYGAYHDDIGIVDFLYESQLDKKIIENATNYKNNGMLQKSNLEILLNDEEYEIIIPNYDIAEFEYIYMEF